MKLASKWLACGLCLTSLPALGERLVSLEGEIHTAKLEAIEETGQARLAGKAEPLPLEDLRAILPDNVPETQSPGPMELRLVAGSILQATAISLTAEKISLDSSTLGKMEFPIDVVRSIRLQPAVEGSRFELAQAETESREHDVVFLTGTGLAEQQEVEGLMESMSEKELKLDEKGKPRVLPYDSVHGVTFASTSASHQTAKSLIHQVLLADGSKLVGRIVSLKDGKLLLDLGGGKKREIPWASVRALRIQSERLSYLSDMKPTKVEQTNFYAYPRSWRKDISLRGQPLALADQVYDKGLSTPGGTSLSFPNLQTYEIFTSLVGIDASRKGLGECSFVVLGDGKELSRLHLRGGEAAKALRVDISQVSEVTLRVEPGDDLLDLADDANWCEACFLKPKRL